MTKQMTVPIVFAVALALASTMAVAAKYHKKTVSDLQVRDWSQIDTNHDNLIEPEEWIKYEAAHPGPLAKNGNQMNSR